MMPSTSPRPTNAVAVETWLKSRFRLPALRVGQADVVFRLLQGERVLFVAPTGHGKSLCYQALAASPWASGVVLVFTPLKALMAEQVERARAHGLRVAFVNSDQSPEEQVRILDEATANCLDMLFIAPERLGNSDWKDRIPNMAVKSVVIDEAHCISQWGHDFRPWYRRLVKIVMGLGLRTPVLAVTATAPGQVVEDVRAQIASPGKVLTALRLPSVRQNVSHQVWVARDEEHRLALLAHAATKLKGKPGIAYFITTREAEQATRWLRSIGLSAVAYHAKLELPDKETRLEEWRSAKFDVVCSTSALGMGMDRADVRWVLHSGLPASLIQYVQEFGRAGRDGAQAQAIAIEDPKTKEIHLGMLGSSAPDPTDYQHVVDAVKSGVDRRTPLVERLDLPVMYVQRLLEDLVEADALRREGSSPARYTLGKGPLPTESATARRVKIALLETAATWAASPDCRRVSLAIAMGDASTPLPCGSCDRCVPAPPPEVSSLLSQVRSFLDNDRPELRENRPAGLSAGVALSWYGMGFLGRSVAEAKKAGKSPPTALIHAAIDALKRLPLSGFAPDFIVYMPPTQSGDFVRHFAEELAKYLGVPAVPLVKIRTTQPQKKFRARLNKEKNLKGALGASAGPSVQGNVLLVDDIWDSGATLREAASLFKRAGCIVHPLVMARTRHSDDQ